MPDVAPSHASLTPVNDCILVRLEQSHNNFQIHESKYDSRTQGIVVATDDLSPTIEKWLGKRVYFEEFKEGARIRRDGELYSFIKIEDVRGIEIVETN